MVAIERANAESPIDTKAILTGSAIYFSGIFNTGLLTHLIFGSLMQMKGDEWIIFDIVNILLSLFFTGIGGYFSARTAGRDYVKHALVSGMVSIGISIALVNGYVAITGAGLVYGILFAIMFVMIGVFASLPAAFLGGMFYASRQKE